MLLTEYSFPLMMAVLLAGLGIWVWRKRQRANHYCRESLVALAVAVLALAVWLILRPSANVQSVDEFDQTTAQALAGGKPVLIEFFSPY